MADTASTTSTKFVRSPTAIVAEDASLAVRAGRFGVKRSASALGHLGGMWFGASTVAVALLSQWDHHAEKKRLTQEYDREIAVATGKRVKDVTIDDMELTAKKNPALKEALRKSTAHRNLNIGITVAAAGAALLLLPTIAAGVAGALPILAGHALISSLVVGGVTGLSFMGAEVGMEKYGEKKLNLKEPSLKSITKHPGKQWKASVPGQVSYLAHQQAVGHTVSEEQVMTVFASANPSLDKAIETRYGHAFHDLDNTAKRRVLNEFGPSFNVEALTDAINNGKIRAQELSFAAYGQSSGVVSPSSAIRPMEMDADAPALSHEAAKHARIGFTNSQVSGVALGQAQSRAETEDTAWRRRIRAEQQQRQEQMVMGAA